MNLENYFISQFKDLHIGDDGAFIDGWVYSKDAFFENIHFKSSWMNHYQIARKAMLVNISDALAMNAEPKFALLAVAMPSSITKAQMRELARGFEETAAEFKMAIIGGDTISNTKLDITVTVISKAKRKPLFRDGVKEGDLIAYTGELGRSQRDLKRLLNLGSVHKNSRFVSPLLRRDFIEKNSDLLHAGMDISDGLFSDLEKLALRNRLGYYFYKKIAKQIACSGEEYELLFAFDKRDKKRVLRRAKQSRTKVTIVAQARRKKYRNRCKAHHF